MLLSYCFRVIANGVYGFALPSPPPLKHPPPVTLLNSSFNRTAIFDPDCAVKRNDVSVRFGGPAVESSEVERNFQIAIK
ncbi:unnamed protein product [Mesocestoides corti]|uniref:Uncharacterized protein n=1 Tax=Mesocestoides corti TaxID=53468 RepID=A0A0R3U184_MESCO|nr:unnamed protein product [Mesocestoides corti]